VTVDQFFDPSNVEHLRAYRQLQKTGLWPQGFLPDNITFPSLWAVTIANKLADLYVEERLGKL
jgi:hypothetical protein